MIERFEGEDGKQLLRQAILDQECIGNNDAIADALLDKVDLVALKPDDVLIHQGGQDNDIYFILAGRVSIQINGRELAIRQHRQHVGEMTLIDPATTRSATVVALEETVVAKVACGPFVEIADSHPILWRRLAMELSNRLRERSKHVPQRNPRPVIFIGSSVEGKPIADEIQVGLSHDYVVPQVWTNNVFIPGHGTMEDLEERISTADFGVLVCTPDDKVINEDRGVDTHAPRDNVILELGMCLGAFAPLGRHRSLVVKPRTKQLKIPTDLLGITPIDYVDDDSANISAHIGSVCTQIRKVVENLGSR